MLVDVQSLTPEATDVCMMGSRYEWLVTAMVRIRDDEGESKATTIVDDLVSALSPSENQLKTFVGTHGEYRVTRLPDPRPPIGIDGWYSVPVDCRLELLT